MCVDKARTDNFPAGIDVLGGIRQIHGDVVLGKSSNVTVSDQNRGIFQNRESGGGFIECDNSRSMEHNRRILCNGSDSKTGHKELECQGQTIEERHGLIQDLVHALLPASGTRRRKLPRHRSGELMPFCR